MFLRKIKTMLLVFVCALLFLPQIALAEGDYSITIRSTYQVSKGGNPEYTITDQQGKSQTIVVSRNEGTTVRVPKGVYKIRETKTTEGFTPQAKKDVVIELPHTDEKGDSHTSVVIEMKSEKYEKPVEPNTIVPSTTEPKDEPKKQVVEEGGPKELNKRDNEPEEKIIDEPEIVDEDEPEDEPEEIDTPELIDEPEKPKDANPKTGDTTFRLEIGGAILVVALGVLLVYNNKKNKNKNIG